MAEEIYRSEEPILQAKLIHKLGPEHNSTRLGETERGLPYRVHKSSIWTTNSLISTAGTLPSCAPFTISQTAFQTHEDIPL